MTRGSIFAKLLEGLAGTGYPNWSSVAIIKEQAGLVVQGIVVKGIIGYFGYELGTMIVSRALDENDKALVKLSEVKEECDGLFRVLDENDKRLVQLEEIVKKTMLEKNSRAFSKFHNF